MASIIEDFRKPDRMQRCTGDLNRHAGSRFAQRLAQGKGRCVAMDPDYWLCYTARSVGA